MRYQKGQSGNPGGRPKVVAEVRELAQSHCRAAVERLVELMADPDGRIAVAACNALLDRGMGKPAQPLTGEDGGPMQVESAVRIYIPSNGREPKE